MAAHAPCWVHFATLTHQRPWGLSLPPPLLSPFSLRSFSNIRRVPLLLFLRSADRCRPARRSHNNRTPPLVFFTSPSSSPSLGLASVLLREPFLKLSLARRSFLAAWEGLLGRELNCKGEGRGDETTMSGCLNQKGGGDGAACVVPSSALSLSSISSILPSSSTSSSEPSSSYCTPCSS